MAVSEGWRWDFQLAVYKMATDVTGVVTSQLNDVIDDYIIIDH